jgi:hypothetical protein
VFEAASILVATATWAMAKAAAAVNASSSTGTHSATATTAYRLLREAAGALQLVQDQLLPLLTGCSAFDLQQELLMGLQQLVLADAQVRGRGGGSATAVVLAVALLVTLVTSWPKQCVKGVSDIVHFIPKPTLQGKRESLGVEC